MMRFESMGPMSLGVLIPRSKKRIVKARTH